MLARALETALRFLLPLTCYHCAADLAAGDAGPLCPSCLRRVEPLSGPVCRACGVPLDDGGSSCRDCRGRAPGALARVRAAVRFGPEVRSLVHAFKYEGRRHLGAPLGGWMAGRWADLPELRGAGILVPVPLHGARLRERGFNQAAVLAAAVARASGLPVVEALARTRGTPKQARLGKRERLENVAGAFEAVPGAGVEGRKVLLVDDLATTTATLEACARVLREAGAAETAAYVLARQPPPTGP